MPRILKRSIELKACKLVSKEDASIKKFKIVLMRVIFVSEHPRIIRIAAVEKEVNLL